MITFIRRIVEWRESHVSDKQFVLLLAVFVGFFAAVAAFVLHWIIRQIQLLLTSGFVANDVNWLYLVYPVIGIYLTSLFIKYIVKDNISHGITRILYAISSKRSRLKAHNMWSSVIASAITIGFGGSVGAEAPIVLTGSAIGSNLGKAFKMDNRTLMLLVGCGAAAAIAGIFKAPSAGLVFTLEVLMIDLTMASLLPILVSAVTAVLFSYLFNGSDSLFQYTMSDGWMIERVPAYILLGVFGGLISLYFIRTMNFCEGVFSRLRHSYQRLLLGGIVLSMLIFLFPALYGEGYSSINILLNGKTEADWAQVMNNSIFYGHNNWLIVFLFLILLTKVFASSATNGGGGCGGVFAPSLFLGCIAGFIFAHYSNSIEFTNYLPEKNFALLGMAGIMSGVMHAPLTGVFLIAELTGGYDLFLPLLIVSVSAYLTIIVFEPHSIYSMRLAKKGELLTHNKDKAILTLMKTENVVEKDFKTVRPEMDMGEMIGIIATSKRNIFPVVDAEGKLLGIVLLDNIRNIMFRQELYHRFTVERLMVSPPGRLLYNDNMAQVMQKFDETNAWNLPVVDKEGRYIGFVSKSKIFNSYRGMLLNLTAE